MGGYLRAVWRCRFFWLSMVKSDLRSRHHGSTLGMGWSVLQPLAMSVIICAAFHNIFGLPITYFGPFLMVGLALWNFILNASIQGCQCFRSAEAYIRQYPAPLAIYPLRTTLGLAFQFLVALGVAILITAFLNGAPRPLPLLSLIPSLALIVVLGWALAVLGGLANVHFPDTSHLAEVGFQGLFFLSPVMYPKDQIAHDPLVANLFRYNPLVFFFRLLREPVLEGHVPALETYAAAALIVLVLTLVAAYLLRRLEPQLIYHL
jgi:ABC-type polysaccharide/polyol phosphate export permease